MADVCGDNRFEIIARAKQSILEGTNIDTSPDEMKVLDNFLFRCWQMGWLDKYDAPDINVGTKWIPCSERLPEEPVKDRDGYIVQAFANNEPFTAYWYGDGWEDDNGMEVYGIIAWQPLPERYREGTELMEKTCENCVHDKDSNMDWPCINCVNNVRDHFRSKEGE